ncbi:MAG: hypothetical protein U0900_15370 [Myxococcota bacterium]
MEPAYLSPKSCRSGALVALNIALPFLLSFVIAASDGQAQVPHVDVDVQQNALDGRLSVHGFDFNALPQFGITAGKRVFVNGISISGNLLLTDAPGFVSRTSTTELNPVGLVGVPGGLALRFNVLSPPLSTMPALGGRNVNYWDGIGAVSWGPTPDADEGVAIIKGSIFSPTNEIDVTGSLAGIPGFVIAATSPGTTGSLHQHLKYLMLPDNGAAPPAGPDNGVYLMLIEVTYLPYAEWIPVFIGFEVFAGGGATQSSAIAAIESDLLRPLCSDGIDNDKDGTIDAPGDPGCVDGSDMSERGALAQCDNGLDDDGDGTVDFPNDSGCLHPTNPIEAPEPGIASMLTIGALGLVGAARRRSSPRLGA